MGIGLSRGVWTLVAGVGIAVALTGAGPAAQPRAGAAPAHATPVNRLLIRNATVIYGNAKPAFGPTDVLVERGQIARVGPTDPKAPPPDAVIDGTGKYVMPGMVNTHVHLRDSRDGEAWPSVQYEFNLYLAAGVTTVRDVGSDFEQARRWRTESDAHSLVAPRIQLYSRIWRSKGSTPAALREGVRFAKEQGSDGLKLGGLDRDQLEAVMEEAHQQGLGTTVHAGVEETTAADYTELGVGSIEHYYGVPDAAFDGVQDFPADTNYANEIHRFARAGELFIQRNLNPERLSALIDAMIANDVSWSPTLSVYEAARDVLRSRNVPWFTDYLHPAIADFWAPDLAHHGSFLFGWTTTEEARWKQSYRVWMDAVREFGRKGGRIVTGDDAGSNWSLYGFGLIRELELLEEAGFHPLEILRHATVNGAELLRLGDRLGRVREGFVADLLVVNGNPLENLRVLNPYGTDVMLAGNAAVHNLAAVDPRRRDLRNAHGGGIEWTIKDGIPYHVPALMKEVKEMVAAGRRERTRQTTSQR